MPWAMSDVESPRATRAATLTSVGVSASQPEVTRWPRGPRAPRLMPYGRSRLHARRISHWACMPSYKLIQCQRVRGEQEVPVLPVGEILDGQGQALAQVQVGQGTLILAPGDQR